MKTTISSLVMLVLFLAGCATGNHIITGEKRAPTTPDKVKIYQVAPVGSEVIGIINVRSSGHSQTSMDAGVAELKRQAAKIGANGVVLGGVNQTGGGVGYGVASGAGGTTFVTSGFSEYMQVQAQAIYVSPESK